MLYIRLLTDILESLVVILPSLLTVAYVTITERNTMASMQRRLGPNIVGYYGLLQAFADALKLLLKEYVSPTQANMVVFFLGPVITLIFSLLSFAVLPYAPGLSLSDFNLAILFLLALSSLATYGILLAGWSANSKYAFLGSLRSTAQLLSYELVLSSVIFLIVLVTSSLNLTVIIECQKAVWLIFPLLPVFVIFFIGAVAETNRAPFDLAEAESELVSGFMTEHSSVIFVFFFLAEYTSIVVICLLITFLFLGGYNFNLAFAVYITQSAYDFLFHLFYVFCYVIYLIISVCEWIIGKPFFTDDLTSYNLVEFMISQHWGSDYFGGQNNTMEFYTSTDNQNLICSLVIAVKTFIMIFTFIWVRASFPRIRYDQLMSYCWTVLLPLVFSLIILIPCVIYAFDMIPNNVLFF